MLPVITDVIRKAGLPDKIGAIGAAVTSIANTLSAVENCNKRTLSNFVRSKG